MAQVAAPQVHGAAVYADDLGAGGRRYVRIKVAPRLAAFSGTQPLIFHGFALSFFKNADQAPKINFAVPSPLQHGAKAPPFNFKVVLLFQIGITHKSYAGIFV